MLLHVNTCSPSIHKKNIKFAAIRLNRSESKICCNGSQVFTVTLRDIKDDIDFNVGKNKWGGYEINERGNMGPRVAKMKESMSPTRYASS